MCNPLGHIKLCIRHLITKKCSCLRVLCPLSKSEIQSMSNSLCYIPKPKCGESRHALNATINIFLSLTTKWWADSTYCISGRQTPLLYLPKPHYAHTEILLNHSSNRNCVITAVQVLWFRCVKGSSAWSQNRKPYF